MTKLVVANRILARHGIVDGFGHVSVRVPRHETGAGKPEGDTFYLSRSLAPASVTADDILRFDLDGNTLDGDTRTPYLERFIHGEIYRVRPDVVSVIHNHSPSVIPFGATRTPLRPIYHMSAFIGARIEDVRDPRRRRQHRHAGAQSSARRRAGRVARDASVVLMRGHGCTVVGESLEQAVYRAIYTEMNARLQKEAVMLGTPTFLNDEEAAKAKLTMDATMSRAWERWVAGAGRGMSR
jgi:HCOMODA/2-hydroxy-3-carboxy-muconic semialdehyde decarboxylase